MVPSYQVYFRLRMVRPFNTLNKELSLVHKFRFLTQRSLDVTSKET